MTAAIINIISMSINRNTAVTQKVKVVNPLGTYLLSLHVPGTVLEVRDTTVNNVELRLQQFQFAGETVT